MTDRPGRSVPFRKRRRQAVVCTGCRRRKIACDRKSPCAQCVQAQLDCTYYQTHTGADFQNDRNSNPQTRSSLSSLPESSTPHVSRRNYEPEASIDTTATIDYQKNFYSLNLGTTAEGPLPMPDETILPNWFETNVLSTYDDPLSIPVDSVPTSLFSPATRVALPLGETKSGRETAIPPGPTSPGGFLTELGKTPFSQSPWCGPTHWITLLSKVRIKIFHITQVLLYC